MVIILLIKFTYLKTYSTFAMERKVIAYKDYFLNFINGLSEDAKRKVFYSIDMLKTQNRVSSKFVKYIREDVYELRAEYQGNIYRVFFIFDDGNIVVLFNAFHKKTQKTPNREIQQAISLKDEYYAEKNECYQP